VRYRGGGDKGNNLIKFAQILLIGEEERSEAFPGVDDRGKREESLLGLYSILNRKREASP
jgi:hypothetical protein